MYAKNPITTDGIPARSSTAGLITSRTPCGANSDVKIAAPTAIGSAMSSATIVTLIVPISSGSSEYLGTVDTGCQDQVFLPVSGSVLFGTIILGTLTSFWISDDVSSGTASFPTKRKMRRTEPMTMNPLDRMNSSISDSSRRGFPARRSGSGFGKRAPGLHLSRVDRLEFRQRDLLKLARLVHENREPVHGHGELDGILAVLVLDLLLFLGLHRTRRLADVRLAIDQRRNADAGASARDLEGDVGVGLHVVLRPALPEDDHRVGALDGDRGLSRRSRARVAALFVGRQRVV